MSSKTLILFILIFISCSKSIDTIELINIKDTHDIPEFPIIDIINGSVLLSKDSIITIMTLKEIPDLIKYNSKEIRKGTFEYYWFIKFDISNDKKMKNDIGLEISYNNFDKPIGEKLSPISEFLKECKIESFIWSDESLNNKLIKGSKTYVIGNDIIFTIPIQSLGDSIKINKETPVKFGAWTTQGSQTGKYTRYEDDLSNKPENFNLYK